MMKTREKTKGHM